MITNSSRKALGRITLRPMAPGESGACAQICFEAFRDVQDRHGFPRGFPVVEAAAGLIEAWSPHPSIWAVVAEMGGTIVGSNFLHKGDSIRAIGPASVSPDARGAGVGRTLMSAVLEWAGGAPGVRLVQDSFNLW